MTLKRMSHDNLVIPTINGNQLALFESRNNLKSLFREIRDYFAGSVTGITRDESIAQNIMRLLFCKMFEEVSPGKSLSFSQLAELDELLIGSETAKLFSQVKIAFPGIFELEEKIEVGGANLKWLIVKLKDLDLLSADRDVVGDAFEELIGTSFRGGEGQFFTPRNVVEMMINVLEPGDGARVIDPACGSGGFLAHTARYLRKSDALNYQIVGIDKDAFLAKIARIYLSLLDPGKNSVFCENSLELPSNWSEKARNQASLGTFDIVLTNPPFGAKIPVSGDHILNQFELAHRWDQENGEWIATKKMYDKQPPQILFIERCIQLLKPGGRMGIVLPEGIFGNPSDRYIWEYLNRVSDIDGVVSLSQETFQPSTHTKTSVLFLTTGKSRSRKKIFMSMAKNIGHNKNGKLIYKTNLDGTPLSDSAGEPILNDDLPDVTQRIKAMKKNAKFPIDHFGYVITRDKINENIYIPEYYNPEIDLDLKRMVDSGERKLLSIGSLISDGTLRISRGKEIGSNHYGTGLIPFVRTSDIVNWEIKVDPIKGVSEEVYRLFQKQMDIQERDILFVNDGTFLIGRTAMVTRLDSKILIQSHVRKLRVKKFDAINPYYLLYLLNTDVVQRQIEAKTFIQATISTIGNRLEEVLLPLHVDKKEILEISSEIKSIVESRADLRERTMKLMSHP